MNRSSVFRLAGAVMLALAMPALAQQGPGRGRGFAGHGYRMSPQDRQRLREQVRSGEMSREQARERWREGQARRDGEPGRLTERDRAQLRRDVQDANRTLDRRP